MPRAVFAPADIRESLLQIYAANDLMNQLLLENLHPRAWRARPPQVKPAGGRTIAAIFAHLHNCRLVWLKRSAPHLPCPKALDPARCTLKQAMAAHRRSGKACLSMLKDAFSERLDRRVTRFSRGSWTRDWPAGATMFAYMFGHEAHHRGQIIAQAHALGYRLPVHAAYGIWHWEKFWKQLGIAHGPR
ncbi:MAG TPA: DinB family protein [Candidatus Solibacter sp.]|nr:DinB family protein [Candidatus Solibacter sp.]